MRFARSTVALMFAVLVGVQASPARAGQSIIAGSITNSPPMISYASDGTTLQGMIVDLAAAMSHQMHRTIVFKSMAFSGLIPALEAHRIDITFSLMNDTPAREKIMDFVDFFNLGTTLLVKKHNPQRVTDLFSLCGKTVSTVRGSTQIILINETDARCTKAGKPTIKNLQYAQPADARLQVRTGRVAAFLGNSPVMSYLARTAGGGTIFDVVAGHVYQPVPLGIGVPKNEPKLRDALRDALNAVIADGTYQKILEHYGVAGGALKAAEINAGQHVKL